MPCSILRYASPTLLSPLGQDLFPQSAELSLFLQLEDSVSSSCLHFDAENNPLAWLNEGVEQTGNHSEPTMLASLAERKEDEEGSLSPAALPCFEWCTEETLPSPALAKDLFSHFFDEML